MTLYLCTETVTISSRGLLNLSNFLFERQKGLNFHFSKLESSLSAHMQSATVIHPDKYTMMTSNVYIVDSKKKVKNVTYVTYSRDRIRDIWRLILELA